MEVLFIKSIRSVHAGSDVTRNLYSDLSSSTVEKGVEHAYWRAISDTFHSGQPIDSDQTDGFIRVRYEESELFLLLEFKFDKDLNKRANSIRVIIQVLFYMHELRDKYASVPNVIMIGDKYHAFVMNTSSLIKYLDREDIDWNISPSSAADKYKTTLVVDMNNDPNISFYIHKLDDSFSFNDLVDDIVLLLSDSNKKIKLNASNISVAFDHFIEQVIRNRRSFTSEELVDIFITVATERDNVYMNPKGSKIVVNHYEVSISNMNYNSFINHFSSKYKPSEKRAFTAMSDRLIHDVNRRANGEFYTPSAFVNYSQERLTRTLGNNWRNSFVVWDPAWGTGNLTRDNGFQHLFASTLNQSDLNQGKLYNKNATKFVFNFLQDDYDFENSALFSDFTDKLPKDLVDILINHPTEKILFFFNPPYATSGNANSSVKSSKKGISRTIISEEMKEKHLKVQEQLYAQFLYRIVKMKENLNLSNLYIGLFSPSLFLTGTKFNRFRDMFFKNFEFLDGNLFKASYFSGVNSNWAIDFSIWKGVPSSKNTGRKKNGLFNHNVLGTDDVGNVEIIGKKELWNTDSDNMKSLQQYLNENTDVPISLNKNVIKFKSRYKTEDSTISIPQNVIGYLVNDTNNVEASAKGVYLMSSPIKRHIKTSIITNDTFAKQMLVFASRKVIDSNWVNQKDEFLAPDEDSDYFNNLLVKSVIYSIFSPANDVISYRNDYEGLGLNNNNPWFFMHQEEIRSLADEYNNESVYNDSIEFSNVPFALQFLIDYDAYLDDEDYKLIDKAKDIVRKTFKFRNIVNDDYPEYSVNTWDASWNQVAQIAKEYTPEYLKEFNKIFIQYVKSVRNLVYKNNILED